jgi:hypothetical protein
MYRLFIEKTGNAYLRISLQYKKGRSWKLKEREYCDAANKVKLQTIMSGYAMLYKIEPHNVIDTRFGYKNISWTRAILNEIKLDIEFYTWKKRLKRLKKQVIILHENSGMMKNTRRKYWIMTDWKGDPMMVTSAIKDAMKRKGWYAKEVDFMALNKECIWNTDNLYA